MQRVTVEAYGASRPQTGSGHGNEDVFNIRRDSPIPYVAICDGSGNAMYAAKRVANQFERLIVGTSKEQALDPTVWQKWVILLDSSLVGGSESTFLTLAFVDEIAVGVCVGDSRLYRFDRDGTLTIPSEGASKHRLGSGRAGAFPLHCPMDAGDILLLLTNGAWQPIGTNGLKKTVVGMAGRPFSELPPAILDAAGTHGRADDMTVVAVRIVR